MIESITFNFTESTLTVTLDNGTSKTYSDRPSYLVDNPSREADCDAMGWA